MCLKKFIIVLTILFAGTTIAHSAATKAERHRDKILSLALMAKAKGDDPKTYELLYKALDDADKLPLEAAIILYFDLTDYYLGEHASEILSEKVTRIGDRITPWLVEKKTMPLKCIDKYKTLCREVAGRNGNIAQMLEAIKNGLVLYCEFPESLKKEAIKDLEVIKIYLKDYKKNKGGLPKDLLTLREYAWQEYGFKLKILNPWGQPLTYSLQGDDKYTLEVGEDRP